MSPLLWALDPGYTSDISQEREREYKEVPILDPILPLAYEPEPPSLVNKKLSLDFQDRYERQFGHRQEEVSIYETQRATTVINSRGEMPSGQETTEAQLQFGHYMVRRLGEYHLDNYLKEAPKARVIYEAKENLRELGSTDGTGTVKTFDNRYEGVKGTPYAFGEWYPGEIFLGSKQKVANIRTLNS